MSVTHVDVKQISEQVQAKSEAFQRLLEQIQRVIVGQ